MDRVPLAEDIKIVTPQENKAVQVEPQKEETLGFMDDIEYHRTADGLNVSYEDRKDPTIADEIAYLMRYANETTGKTDRLDLILALKSIQKGIGFTEEGKLGIKKLYQWARLDSQRRTIEKKMEILK